MRILHVIATLEAVAGGPSRAVVDMATAAARQGHDVSIYTTDYGGQTVSTEAANEAGVDIQRFPVSLPQRFKRSPQLYHALKEQVGTFDAVHLHSLYLYHCWATWKACKASGVPYVLRPHGTLDPYLYRHHRSRKKLIELLFQDRVTAGATLIHYTAEDERRLAEPFVKGVPGWVVPLPIETEEFAKLPPADRFREAWPEIADRHVVLFYGRLNFKKGLDVLIEAFELVTRTRDDVALVIAGPDGGMRSQVEQWVDARDLRQRTVFTGMLSGKDGLAAFAAADLFVLTSYTENFGRAVAEAMAAGLPVVVSDQVNIWREVESANAGIVVPPDAARTADAILRLLNDPQAARQMGVAGRRMVSERFSPAGVGAELSRMYEEVLRCHNDS